MWRPGEFLVSHPAFLTSLGKEAQIKTQESALSLVTASSLSWSQEGILVVIVVLEKGTDHKESNYVLNSSGGCIFFKSMH